MAMLLPNLTDKLYAKATATPYLTVADKLYAKGAEMAMPYPTATGKLYAKGVEKAMPYLTVADKLYAKGVEKAMPYPTATGKLYAKGAEMVMPYPTATEKHSSQVVGSVRLFSCHRNQAKLNHLGPATGTRSEPPRALLGTVWPYHRWCGSARKGRSAGASGPAQDNKERIQGKLTLNPRRFPSLVNARGRSLSCRHQRDGRG